MKMSELSQTVEHEGQTCTIDDDTYAKLLEALANIEKSYG